MGRQLRIVRWLFFLRGFLWRRTVEQLPSAPLFGWLKWRIQRWFVRRVKRRILQRLERWFERWILRRFEWRFLGRLFRGLLGILCLEWQFGRQLRWSRWTDPSTVRKDA
ncbi:hypothetical protein GCM10023156_31850 [Novipirellula rosea]|uniref:Uncharacterized protein n=1 Tax=Novipirellula rosea TaxID=1031540 RepID=A0ABP8MWA4_9BACT